MVLFAPVLRSHYNTEFCREEAELVFYDVIL